MAKKEEQNTNVNANLNENEKLTELTFTASVEQTEYDGKKSIKVIMPGTVIDKDFDAVVLSFEKLKQDRFGNEVSDNIGKKKKGPFDFYAKKHLALNEKLEVSGVITYQSFKGNPFVSIEIKNPFDDGMLRMYPKRVEDKAVIDKEIPKVLKITAPGTETA